MQFMPATAKGLGVDPTDPASSIDGAARYLSDLTQQFGSTELALAAYNAGPGTVRRHGGIPPYAETQSYVQKVTSAAEAYT
jgi:soluble lytic murein transglycosylase-like protein